MVCVLGTMVSGMAAREPSALRASLGASARCPARPCHRPRAPQPVPSGPSGALHAGGGGGFALHEAFRGRVVGVSDPRVVQFSPFGGGKNAI